MIRYIAIPSRKRADIVEQTERMCVGIDRMPWGAGMYFFVSESIFVRLMMLEGMPVVSDDEMPTP